MRIFHSDTAYFSAIVGREIIYLIFCIHARGVNGAEISFICPEKSGRLVDGAHKMKKARDGGSLFLDRQGVGLGVGYPYKSSCRG